ncbi:MAG: hypothetical protein ACP5OG_02175 [Candidatus Nanoarchaeia archaeon]
MKNSIIPIILLVVAVFAMVFVNGCSESIPKDATKEGYTINYSENGIIDVIAYSSDTIPGTAYAGYGSCLISAINEVKKNYEIQHIVEYAYDGSGHGNGVTRRLNIIAKPKLVEENNGPNTTPGKMPSYF